MVNINAFLAAMEYIQQFMTDTKNVFNLGTHFLT